MLFACSLKSSSDSTSSNDTQTVGPNEVPSNNLNGNVPAVSLMLPEFTALNADGNTRNKENLLDQRTVLWFYPITGTPGWTLEGCGFRDLYEDFQALNVEIIGVGFGEPSANQAWIDDQGYQYEIWSDTNRTLAVHYGAADSVDQSYPSRVTKLIDTDGTLILEYNDASFLSNPQDVLDDCNILFANDE